MKKHSKIVLVRHGQSEANVAGIVSGQVGDPALTDEGRQQALQAKSELAHHSFDIVYSSDLQRAIDTAAAIFEDAVPHEQRLPALRERHFGALEGATFTEITRYHPDRMQLSAEENWHFKYVPDMESDHELASRFVETLQQIAEENHAKTVLVVAHGSAIRTVIMKLGNLTYHDVPNGSFKNAGYIEIDYDGKSLEITKVVGVEPLN